METPLKYIDYECDGCGEQQNGELYYSCFPNLGYIECNICNEKTYFILNKASKEASETE